MWYQFQTMIERTQNYAMHMGREQWIVVFVVVMVVGVVCLRGFGSRTDY